MREIRSYNEKLKKLIMDEAGIKGIPETSNKFGVPKSTIHTWMNVAGQKDKPKIEDGTSKVILIRINQLEVKIDKLLAIWQGKDKGLNETN